MLKNRWFLCGVASLIAILALLINSGFRPPMHPRYVLMIAAAPALLALSAVRWADIGDLWRRAGLWAGVLGVLVVIRQVVAFVAGGSVDGSLAQAGPFAFGAGIALTLIASGFAGSRQSGRVRVGILTAITSGFLIVAPVFLIIVLSRTHAGQLLAPAVMLSIATILGSVGAMLGYGEAS